MTSPTQNGTLSLDHLPATLEMLRSVTDTVEDALFVKDRQGRYLFCNAVAARQVGRPAEQMIGRDDQFLFGDEGAREIRNQDERVMLTGNQEHTECVLTTDNVTRIYRVTKSPYRDHQGAIQGVIGIARDITDQKQAEETIRRIAAGISATGNEYFCALVGHLSQVCPAECAGATHIVQPDGSTAWLEEWGTPQREPDVTSRRLNGAAVDIREREPAETAIPGQKRIFELIAARTPLSISLQESEERYRRLVDVLPGALFVHDGGKIVFCNPAFVRLMGAESPAELLGRSPFSVAHPDYHDIVRSRIDSMRSVGQASAGIEMRIIRLDGRTVPVYSVSTPFAGSENSTFLVALSDLTERERSTELLKSVLGSVSDAILTINYRGTIQTANSATEAVFGYRADDLIGQNVKMLMNEPYHSEHDSYIADYLNTGIAKMIGVGREVEGRRQDGSTFPLELTVTEFKIGGRRHFTGVVRDITSRKRLEAQFHQAQKMDAIGRLAGGVAHDFNNLLTIINGYTELMLMRLPIGDRMRESVAAIQDAGESAARLTRQLLAFSRRAAVEPMILDLNALVAQSALLVRRLIGEDILMETVPDPSLERIKADVGQIEQVILNLVVNARDAMPTGGRLIIETRNVVVRNQGLDGHADLRPGHYARLSVTDTGCGVPDELKSKIFEPFFTTKGVGQGTGLGLAVVHGVVKQCGGSIGVESTVGSGTTFHLMFPVAVEATVGDAPGVVLPQARGTETLILVEDEVHVRTIARIALESQGFTVLEAGDGNDALRVIEKHAGSIDLLVTDVVMPKMGGHQLVQNIRILRPGLRALYITGYTDDAVFLHGLAGSSDAILRKPFTPLALARKVRAVLDETRDAESTVTAGNSTRDLPEAPPAI